MWFWSLVAKLGCSKTIRGSNATVLYSARPSEGDGSDVITVCFRGSYLVKQAKFSSAVIATTIFTAKASHTQNIIFDHTLPLTLLFCGQPEAFFITFEPWDGMSEILVGARIHWTGKLLQIYNIHLRERTAIENWPYVILLRFQELGSGAVEKAKAHESSP